MQLLRRQVTCVDRRRNHHCGVVAYLDAYGVRQEIRSRPMPKRRADQWVDATIDNLVKLNEIRNKDRRDT